MTGGADDVARLINRLAERVDRLENRGEGGQDALSTTELIEETLAFDVVVELVTWRHGDDRFIGGFGRDVSGFGRIEPGLNIQHTKNSTDD